MVLFISPPPTINGGCSSHSPVFFMAEVRELRMELIFPRSTFSMLTPMGVPPWPGGLPLGGLVGVAGGLDAAPPFAVFSTAVELFSFLSSAAEKETRGHWLLPGRRPHGVYDRLRHRPSAAAPSASSSDMSMSSVPLFSLGPSPSSMALPSSSGSTWALLGPRPRKGESEPVGEGASSEGEGMGESSGPGRVDLRESSFLFRLATRLAKAL